MDELFSPQMAVHHYVVQRGISVKEIGVAPTVVMSWWNDVIQSLAADIGAQRSKHWLYGEHHPFFTGRIQGQRVSLAHVPVGAPGTIMMMEEMIACSAGVFFGLGRAGSLQPFAPVGSLLVPTACIREEGTSRHYVGDEDAIAPDTELVELLEASAKAEGVTVIKGPLWTTDAPYRELRSKVKTYAEQGVLGVDMETSAMYTLGVYRKVRVCNLLVVSDELGQEWRPSFRTPQLREATKKAQAVMVRCLGNLLG